jgi:hypothetical protein
MFVMFGTFQLIFDRYALSPDYEFTTLCLTLHETQVLEEKEVYNLAMQARHPNSKPGDLARNLRENQLGGVIFGCKHDTIEECFRKQLFG